MALGPLRRRLLLQYLLTVGLLLAGAGALLYVLMGSAGERELDATLRTELARLAAAVEIDDKRPRVDGKRSLERSLPPGRQTLVWQVVLADGTTLLRSRRLASKAMDLPAVGGKELPLEAVALADARDGDGLALRAARLRTVRERQLKAPAKGKKPPPKEKEAAQRQVVFDIRAAVSREPLDEQQAQLAWYLIGGFPLVLGLAAVGGVCLIRRAVRPVERAFDHERRFTGAVSHELRTPLTALRGEIELTLRRERTPAEYAAALERLQPVVSGMADTVEGLLVLARAKAGHLLLGAGEVHVETIHRLAEEVIQLLPGRERVALSCAVTEDRKVVGDGVLLALAVRNLVENALLHGAGARVRARLESDSAAGLRLTVEDDGPGIPADVLAAFEAARTDLGPTPRRDGGVGFGLSIARAVVEAHGGTLTLANLPEGGCRAELSLPGISG